MPLYKVPRPRLGNVDRVLLHVISCRLRLLSGDARSYDVDDLSGDCLWRQDCMASVLEE
jgi:hypothetical protein